MALVARPALAALLLVAAVALLLVAVVALAEVVAMLGLAAVVEAVALVRPAPAALVEAVLVALATRPVQTVGLVPAVLVVQVHLNPPGAQVGLSLPRGDTTAAIESEFSTSPLLPLQAFPKKEHSP